MKKIHYKILFCFVLLISMCSCVSSQQKSKDGTIIENNITFKEYPISKENKYKSISLTMGELANIMAIYNNNIIYERYNDKKKISYFYRFDLKNNTTYQLGTLKNTTVSSGSICQILDKLYFYINTMDWKTEKEICNLCEIDLNNNKLQVVQSESVKQSLVYVDVLEGNLLSYKGRNNEKQATTIIEQMDIKDKKIKELISVNLDIKSNTGEVIHNFCQNEGYIYTIGDDNNGESSVYLIKKYNEKGKYIRTISIEEEVLKEFNNGMIATFEVIGDYAFIEDFGNNGVLIDINSEVAIPKIIGVEFYVAIQVHNDKPKKEFILTKSETNEIWVFNTENCTLSELDINVNNKNDYVGATMINEGSNILLFTDENRYLVDYKEIPIKKTIDMTDELIEFYN